MVIVSRVKRNPYVTLLAKGLAQPDLCLKPILQDRFSLQWMWRHRREVDVLHIHWLELLYAYPSRLRSLKRWLSVMLALLLARLSGICLVYTVHNIWQHEGHRVALMRLGNWAVFALAHAVHVHDQDTVCALAIKWRRRNGVFVIPHGSYVGAYPNDCSRATARQRLGLEDTTFVYLSLGRVRPYKGVEELISAFRALPDKDIALLIAGEPHEPGYVHVLRQAAGADPRVRLDLQFVDEDALQVYLNACDVCALPYRHVTTSGAALLSFSFTVPIIAPNVGCFVQLLGKNRRGIGYDPMVPGSLNAALGTARDADLSGMKMACARYVEPLEWDIIARQHAAMYQECDEDHMQE